MSMSRLMVRYPVSSNLANHANHVYTVVQGRREEQTDAEVSSSWQRSAHQHRVDPDGREAPRILTSGEVSKHREPLDQLIFNAADELNRLYKVVREAGYTLLFCNNAGVAVEHRGDESDASRFRYWGTWLGGVWGEAFEGTNGIGTVISEERPVTIHRRQHYRTRHIELSCSGAPIFGTDGRLIAVLDVSAVDPVLSERAHALTGVLTTTSARAIEERFFREQFRSAWIIALAMPEHRDRGMLLAVDHDQRIIGADRAARATFLLEDERLRAGVGLWTLFERDRALFRRHTGDIATRLIIAGSDEVLPTLVTPPDRSFSARQDRASVALHTRPRADALIHLPLPTPTRQARGGLSPAAMRRVRDYIDAHLSESIELVELSGIAGLSMFHFARQFKHSEGITPHYYLVSRRVARAKELLEGTHLPLSEIALAVGFADQSHLTRHFRQIAHTTPGRFRRSL
jgi:transcriptional regulator of acetoin/glycerol metabolism/AraC-like DNA-binding protein